MMPFIPLLRLNPHKAPSWIMHRFYVKDKEREIAGCHIAFNIDA